MAVKNPVDSRDVRFILFEMLQAGRLSEYKAFKDFSPELADEILTLAETIAAEQVYSVNSAADSQGCSYDPETASVHVPDVYGPAMKAFYRAGFMGLSADRQYGGRGLPAVLNYAVTDFFTSASASFVMYPLLSEGAFNMYARFLPESPVKQTIMKKLLSGEWGGSMCLTEPGAGSDVGALRTRAVRNPDGSWSITGQKIFITAGDSDLFENSVHPVLARIEGDPAGTEGISIFAVPKYRINPDGSVGERNDVVCSGIEHKMGLTASATCVLNFGDHGKCQGFILGQERQGMKIMFQMMNETRLHVANQGMSVSGAAYIHAADYAWKRFQGRNPLSAEAGSTAIVNHPDIKRILLSMKARVQAMRALSYYCGLLMDLEKNAPSPEAEEAGALLEFLIPINKAGNADTAWDVTADAIQIFGGYGYCRDNIVEQYARDAKIFSIYEGTNGIQSMDLMLRKLLLDKTGSRYSAYLKNVRKTVRLAQEAGVPDVYIKIISDSLEEMNNVTAYLRSLLMSDMERLYLNAVPLQKAFTVLTYGWMQLWGLACAWKEYEKRKDISPDSDPEAAFYKGRVLGGRYYLSREMKMFRSWCSRIMESDDSLKGIDPAIF